MLTVGEVARVLEERYPLYLASDWDNSGLQVGSRGARVTRVIVSLDPSPLAIERAIREKAELLVTHHPLLFRGVKRICFDQPEGQLLRQLCREDIAVYSLHTNLDRAPQGLNSRLADMFGLLNAQPFGELLEVPCYKLVVYVPRDHLEVVRKTLGDAGAGFIGGYSHCTFAVAGEGTFLPGEGSHPYLGQVGELARVPEYRLETIVDQPRLAGCLQAMLEAHPYEEVAYDIYPVRHPVTAFGFGRWGKLPRSMTLGEVAEHTRQSLNLDHLRLVGAPDRPVSTLAVVSGSGASLIPEALALGVDLMITGDIKYHEAQDAFLHGLALIDAGHDGLEQVAVDLVGEYLGEKLGDRLDVVLHREPPVLKIC